MAICDGDTIRLHKDLGYVRQVFGHPPSVAFSGGSAVGHVRYPTAVSNRVQNAQPHLMSDLSGARFALSSNGDVTNYREVRDELEQAGVAFRGSNAEELLLNFIAFAIIRRDLSVIDAIRAMQSRVQGA